MNRELPTATCGIRTGITPNPFPETTLRAKFFAEKILERKPRRKPLKTANLLPEYGGIHPSRRIRQDAECQLIMPKGHPPRPLRRVICIPIADGVSIVLLKQGCSTMWG